MIKYTILYKNGKTWNGKVNRLYDLARPANDAVLLWVKGESGSSIYIPGVCSSWTNVPGTSTGKKSIRKPNPASVTKKQKKFDEDYARWVRDWHLRGSSDITMQAYKKWLWEQKKLDSESEVKAVASGRTPGDVLMLRTEETSLDEFVKVDVSHRDVVEVYTNGEIKYVTVKGEDGWIPWRGGECPVPANTKVWVKWKGSRKPHFTDDPQGHQWKQYGSFYDIVAYKLFNEPIETTYTFWLGASGEIIDDK